MKEWFGPVSKAIGGFIGTAIVAWFTKNGLDVPGDVADWIKTATETALLGLVGAIFVYFTPANKPAEKTVVKTVK